MPEYPHIIINCVIPENLHIHEAVCVLEYLGSEMQSLLAKDSRNRRCSNM